MVLVKGRFRCQYSAVQNLSSSHPSSPTAYRLVTVCHYLPLPGTQEGEAFAAAADAYVRKFLLRGIPSLFSGA